MLIKISHCLLFLCLGQWHYQAIAAPYQPDDEAILLQLSSTQQQRSSTSDNPAQRLQQAQNAFKQGRDNNNPRAIGRAQGLLKHWLINDDTPVNVLLLQAEIAQYQHDFSRAKQYIQRIFTTNPKHSQAWLILAFIERVQGNYIEAQTACLAAKSQQLIAAQLCQASVQALQGQAKKAYQQLAQLTQLPAAMRQWQQTEMGMIQARLGQPKKAQQHFQQALLIPQRDHYLLAAYADFLLNQNKATTVLHLLVDETHDDGLLLRAILAAKVLNKPEAKLWQRTLQARFNNAILRQESLHQREMARFSLSVLKQPQQALTQALANWSIQKEPEDALLVLLAAKASQHTDAADAVRTWVKRHHWHKMMDL